MHKIHRVILYFSLFCLVLNIYNIFVFKTLYPSYLSWNLLLAFIPYLIAIYLAQTIKRKGKTWKWTRGLLVFLWLIFFPNCIYLITDFVHLYQQTYLPVWFDIAEIFSFTFIGFLLGFLSLYKIEKIITKKFNSKYSIAFIITSIFLADIGVYMGRNLRWNSWDLFVHPWQIITNVIYNLANLSNFLNFISMVLVFSSMFIGIYFSLRALLQARER